MDGEKAARLPVKVSGEDQETPGLMLMWASVQTGRYFMYILTPATGSKVDLGALIDEAAGAVSCAGAGKVQEPVAVFDPTPAGWWRDESDAPRIMYGRRDNKQTVLIWSSKRSSSKYDCAEPAQTLFDRFLDDPKLSQAGESRTEVDNSDGSAEGAVLCRVQADVSGWSEAEGDRILYTQWICSGREDRTVASLEILAGDLGEAYLNPRDHAVCLDEVPEEVAEELQETPPEEKTQWVPPKQETKEKKKKKK